MGVSSYSTGNHTAILTDWEGATLRCNRFSSR